MNWAIIIPVILGALAIVVYLVYRNLKDKKEYEHSVNINYKKPKDEEEDLDAGLSE